MQLDGVYQIASFHPEYQFAGTAPDAAENYSNRAPYPLLHLLREDSLERAIANYPDVEQIPARNIALLNDLGTSKLKALLDSCVRAGRADRKSTRLNSSTNAHLVCRLLLEKKKLK